MSGGSPASDESYEDIPQATILRLCANNEWGQADSILRTLKKGAEEVNYTKVSNYSGCWEIFTKNCSMLC